MTNDKVSLKDIYNLLKEFREEIRKTYVTKNEFWPVKALVYGFVIIILTAVATALIARVVIAN